MATTRPHRDTHRSIAVGKDLYVAGDMGVVGTVALEGLTLSGAPVQVQRIKLSVASGTAAGVHTGSVTVPAGAILIDVLVHAVAVWDAGTSAALIVGDAADPNGFYDAVNMKATDLLAAESLSFSYPAGQFGADVVVDYTSVATIGASYIKRRYLSTARVVTAELTTVGSSTAGETYVDVVYSVPATSHQVTATFVAS